MEYANHEAPRFAIPCAAPLPPVRDSGVTGVCQLYVQRGLNYKPQYALSVDEIGRLLGGAYALIEEHRPVSPEGG